MGNLKVPRMAHGVSPRGILDAVRNPIRVVPDAARGTVKYVGRDAEVVLNSHGEVVSTWPTGRAGFRY